MASSPSSAPPPAPYVNPDELEPTSQNFNPDVLADHLAFEESEYATPLSSSNVYSDALKDMIPKDRRVIRYKFSTNGVDPDKAVKWISEMEDPDSRGIYEDTLTDLQLGSSGILANVREKRKEPVSQPEHDQKMRKDRLSITRAMLIQKIRKTGSFEGISSEDLIKIAPTPGQLQALVTGITGIPPNSTFKPGDALKESRRARLKAAKKQTSLNSSFPSISPSPEETLLKIDEDIEA